MSDPSSEMSMEEQNSILRAQVNFQKINAQQERERMRAELHDEMEQATRVAVAEALAEAAMQAATAARTATAFSSKFTSTPSFTQALSAPETTHIVHANPIKPDVFKNAESTNPAAWIFQLESYYRASTMPDAQRVHYAAAYFRDAAQVWWQAVMSDERSAPCSWVDFKYAFLAEFQPLQASETSRSAIFKMKQLGSVTDYTKEFRSHLYLVVDMSSTDKLAHYLNGLKDAPQSMLRTQNPSNVEEAMSMAKKNEANNMQVRQSHTPHVVQRQQQQPYQSKHYVFTRQQQLQQQQQHRNSEASSSSPMDVSHLHHMQKRNLITFINTDYQGSGDEWEEYDEDSYIAAAQSSRNDGRGGKRGIRGGRGGSSRSPALWQPFGPEKARDYDENKCFTCHKVGHQALECPNKKSSSKNE